MSTQLQQHWIRAQGRFAGRSARERALLVAIACALAVVIGDRAILHPTQLRWSALNLQLEALDPALLSTDAVRRADSAVLEHRRQLAGELAQVDASLDALKAQMVSPAQMKQLVESLIAALPGLRLVQLRNDPPQALEGNGAAGAAAAGQVYRHGFTLTVEGNYSDLLQYLDRMETTGHRIFWKRVDIDANAYPADRMVIDFYTLSRDPTWLVL
jgi:hypothetical protein